MACPGYVVPATHQLRSPTIDPGFQAGRISASPTSGNKATSSRVPSPCCYWACRWHRGSSSSSRRWTSSGTKKLTRAKGRATSGWRTLPPACFKLGADPANLPPLSWRPRNHGAPPQRRPICTTAWTLSDWVTRCLRNCIDEFTARLQSGLAKSWHPVNHAPFIA